MSTSAARGRILALALAACALAACASALDRVSGAGRLDEAASRVADGVASTSPMGPVCRDASKRLAAAGIVLFLRGDGADGGRAAGAAELYSTMGCPMGAVAAISFGAADEARALAGGERA